MPIGGTAFFGMNQHPRITTNYLNQLNRHGDPGPGLNVGGVQDYVNGGQVGFSGQIAQPYSGFIGGKLTITNPWAKQFSDPLVGPLYGGIYMYVQFDPTATTPATPGAVCFWLDEQNYIVTPSYVAGVSFKPAGIIINQTSPGNWDFIQIAGIATVLFSAAAAVGALVGFTGSTPPAPTVAAGGATGGSATFLGTALMAAVGGQKSPVEINLPMGYNY